MYIYICFDFLLNDNKVENCYQEFTQHSIVI
jgi:hypothetical protein